MQYLSEIEKYRRNLPHWRMPCAVYFVTWRLHPSQILRALEPDERMLVASAIKHFDGDRFALHGWVVMDDHAHVLIQPFEGHDLTNIMHSIKSFTANQLQRRFARIGAVWQEESFDRIMRDEEEYFEKLNYILANPQRRWPDMRERYQWVGTGSGIA